MIKTADRLEGIGEYYFSQKLREIAQLNDAGRKVINLGIGSPDLPPDPSVIRVLGEEASKPGTHAYQSYKGVPELRQAFANWYKRWYSVDLDPEKEILPLIGSKEGIMHICMTYLNSGDFALVPDPGYPTYSSAVRLAGATPVPYELTEENNWYPDFGQLERLIAAKAGVKILFVNYPHMPTGQSGDTELFSRIVAFGKKHRILICHDNPYSFILNDKPTSLLEIPGAKEVVLELNSLSKSHNMAGWRVGVLCGAAQRISEVLRFKSNMDSGMFLPVQLAAAKALESGRDWHESINQVYRQRREQVIELLRILDCRIPAGQTGMFIWAAIPSGYADAYALTDEVLNRSDVFLTPGGIFGKAGNNYIRVSLCSPEEIIKEAIHRVQKSRS